MAKTKSKIFKHLTISLAGLAMGLGVFISVDGFRQKPVEPAFATYTNGDAATYYNSIDDTQSGNTLLTALRDLNLSKRKSTVGYSSMGTTPSGQFKYTDYDTNYVQYDSNGQPYGTKISSFYTFTSATSWNREHVWPNSHGGGSGGSAGSPYPDADIHMPRPTISSENSSRGNSYFVEGMNHSSNGWDPYTAGYSAESRGEAARITFYCMTVNSRLSLAPNNTAPSGKDPITGNSYSSGTTMGNLETLIKWNINYPVSQRERNRNEGAEYLQGNRNAFIDHPEYACKIWGNVNSNIKSMCSAASWDTGTGVSLSQSKVDLEVDDVATLSATSSNSGVITWSSSDTTVVTVSSSTLSSGANITLTGVGPGTATVTAQATINGQVYSASCSVTVTSSGSGGGGGEVAEEGSISASDLDSSYPTSEQSYTAASGITFKAKNAANFSSKIQFKKSGGYIYSTTAMNLKQLVLNNVSGTLTVYGGTSANPSTKVTGTGGVYNMVGKTYFKIINESETVATCSSINISTAESGSTDITLSSIAVQNPKTDYDVGDSFEEPTVIATYSDGSTDDVSSAVDFIGYDLSTAGTQTVTVTYSQDGVTKTTTYSITVTGSGGGGSGGGGGSSDEFTLYSGTITEGDYLITSGGKAVKNTVSSDRLSFESVTVSNDKVTTTDSSIIWHIAASDNYWTLYNAAESKYAVSTGAKNKAGLSSTLDDKAKWTVTGSSTYEFENKYNDEHSVNDLLRLNGSLGFACYSSSTGSALTLYKASEDASSGKTLTNISVFTAPTKTDYYAEEFFDPTGLVITREYDDESSNTFTYAEHESKFTFNPSLSTALTTTNESVTITYGGVSTTLDISVQPLVLSYISTANQKVEYEKGATFSYTGTCTAHYNNNSVKTVTPTVDSSGVNMNAVGTYTVGLSYAEGGVTRTTSYTITVTLTPFVNTIEQLYSKEIGELGSSSVFYGLYMGYTYHTTKGGQVYYDLFIGNGDYAILLYGCYKTLPEFTAFETGLSVTGGYLNIYENLYEVANYVSGTSYTLTVNTLTSAQISQYVAPVVSYTVTGLEAGDNVADQKTASRLATLSGTVVSVSDTISSSNEVTVVVKLANNNTTNIFIKANAGLDYSKLAESMVVDNEVTIRCFTSIYKTQYQLVNPQIVEASSTYTYEDFAADLLSLTNSICSSSGEKETALSGVWLNLKVNKYTILSSDAKQALHDANANESGSVTEQAMARYDQICRKYESCENFINRSSAIRLNNAYYLERLNSGDSNLTLIVILTASFTSLTLIALIIKKRRRMN